MAKVALYQKKPLTTPEWPFTRTGSKRSWTAFSHPGLTMLQCFHALVASLATMEGESNAIHDS